MEVDGHPTQDLVEELERRGAARYPGNSVGPEAYALGGPTERGIWLFLTRRVYDTEIDVDQLLS